MQCSRQRKNLSKSIFAVATPKPDGSALLIGSVLQPLRWFNWLEWVLVLGAFEYLAGKHGAWLARLISAISIPILWFYFNGFFFRIQFKGLFRAKSVNAERIASIIISGILASGCWFIAQTVAKAIAANTK